MDLLKDVFTDERINGIKATLIGFSGFLLGITIVIIFVLFGWFVVWRMFLMRFPLIKELVYGNGGKSNSKTKGQPLRRSARLKEKKPHHED